MKFLHHFLTKKLKIQFFKIQINLFLDWNFIKKKEPLDRQSKNEFNFVPSFQKKRIKIVLLFFSNTL